MNTDKPSFSSSIYKNPFKIIIFTNLGLDLILSRPALLCFAVCHFFHIDMNCIPAPSEMVSNAHELLSPLPPFQPHLSLSKCAATFIFLTVSTRLFFSSSSENTSGASFRNFWSSWDTMAHYIVGSKVWLWRAVTWPMACFSTLCGIVWEVGSDGVAGRIKEQVVFIVLQYFQLGCICLLDLKRCSKCLGICANFHYVLFLPLP